MDMCSRVKWAHLPNQKEDTFEDCYSRRHAFWVEALAKEEARRLMDKIMRTAGRPFLELKVDFLD